MFCLCFLGGGEGGKDQRTQGPFGSPYLSDQHLWVNRDPSPAVTPLLSTSAVCFKFRAHGNNCLYACCYSIEFSSFSCICLFYYILLLICNVIMKIIICNHFTFQMYLLHTFHCFCFCKRLQSSSSLHNYNSL